MIRTAKNVAQLLLFMGALMVSVHTAALTAARCTAGECMASVYFGIPPHTAELRMPEQYNTGLSTESYVNSPSVTFADVNVIVQTVGLYALLLGVVLVLMFEIAELQVLRRMYRKQRSLKPASPRG